MIACPNCSKENQDHYKFCLSCGAKLPGATAAPPASGGAPGPSAPPPPQMAAPPAPFAAGTPTPPPGVPSAPGSTPTAGPGAASSPCPACTFENPDGFKFCGRCGATLPTGETAAPADMGSANTIFVDDASEVQAEAGQAEAGHTPDEPGPPAALAPIEQHSDPPELPTREGTGPRPSGGTTPSEVVPASLPMSSESLGAAATAPAGAGGKATGPAAKLIMLGPDGQPIGERILAAGENLQIGRNAGPPWDDDAYLNPDHAELSVEDAGILVQDVHSLNGVFIKLSDRVEIQHGDQFRVGQELLLYEDLPEPTPTDDGTERMGSPNPGYWGRLSVLVDPDAPSMAFPIDGDGLTIGRETGDITFPTDGYVSGTHCRLVGDDNGVYMEDAGSSNGTYMRVRTGQIVPFGGLILIGQKLFQIDRLD